MKLTDLVLSEQQQFLTDEDDIWEWLRVYCEILTPFNSRIDILKDGTVNCDRSITIHKPVDYIKVKFGEVENYFNADKARLKSLKGSPTEIVNIHNKSWICYGSEGELTSFEGITKDVHEVSFLRCNGLTSLKDIDKHAVCTQLFIPPSIKSHLLSAMKIPNIKSISTEQSRKFGDIYEALKIIKPFIGHGNAGILDAQTALIDADLEHLS